MSINELKELVDLDWKQTINNFIKTFDTVEASAIDNMHEKTIDEYIDVDYYDFWPADDEDTEYVPLPKNIEDIANYVAKLVDEYEYPEDASKTYHAFMHVPKELSESIGLDEIYVCNYRRYENGKKLSNYMYMGFNNSLTIDLYNCDNILAEYEDFFERAITELYNFKRDMKYVIDGIYEKKMLEMKEIKNRIAELGAAKFLL